MRASRDDIWWTCPKCSHRELQPWHVHYVSHKCPNNLDKSVALKKLEPEDNK